MGLFTYAKASPTKPESLSPTTWPTCWTLLEDIVSKRSLVCGGSCLWVQYNFDWYRHSHYYFDCKEGDIGLNSFKKIKIMYFGTDDIFE